MNLRKRVDELERDVKNLRDILVTQSKNYHLRHDELRSVVVAAIGVDETETAEEVPPQPRQLAVARYAVGQHVQVNTLGEWEDATVMSINECDVCPGTYQIATDATETCRHERDVRTAPDETDGSEVPEVSSLARLGGPCPSCGRVVNWELVSPLTEPVEPEHTLLGIPIRAPRATGWEMPCGCRLDEWTLYTKIGPKEMLIRLTSPDGIASSEVTCPVTPMTCPMDGTEGLEK